MELGQMKMLLEQEIQELERLRKHLVDADGRQLTPKEKQKLRMVVAETWLADLFRDMKNMFLEGNIRPIADAFVELEETNNQLS